jgi:hypothetical protein
LRPFLPRKLEPVAFGFLLTFMMTFIVAGVSTAIVAGVNADLPRLWLAAWLPSWAIAFPSVLVVAPLVRRILSRIVRQS